ncbi:3'(2'),5'-bisphosphate nucleotidase CysQ [Celeribacter indicus]|uniref:Inositol-phosphate phosphatase n=1 Tax=Celeribacter indicus TaxID=1208324 RepID=A0A0B5DV87_9RHOB|nr:3'(2'),5'-bisphosphate nucleotidase CysQ [Celeribacter indicus]AJE45110.1 inositol-phosphate phosphatase [Celeribacter indicus]SDX27243.1 myo-inositol-1(or 4)-monophosphatase [Celeribacter indicus]
MRANDDLELLIEAARNAGDIARPYWRAEPKAWDKGGGAGPVTEADLAVDRMLHEYLLSERPDYGWLSEETVDTTARLGRNRVFIVDPIDGTRSFIDGDRNWAHSLAIAEEGEVVAAVVYLPLRDRLFTATKGEGARLNDETLHTSGRCDLDGAQVLATRHHLRDEHWKGGTPKFVHKFRPSLAYRLSLVAQGRYDAMLTLRETWEWDVAAGTLIVAEAGGRVSDRRGAPPRFNRPIPKIDGLVAGCPPLAQGILDRLA